MCRRHFGFCRSDAPVNGRPSILVAIDPTWAKRLTISQNQHSTYKAVDRISPTNKVVDSLGRLLCNIFFGDYTYHSGDIGVSGPKYYQI